MTSVLKLPSRELSLERVQVMGILNTTPDSFYDQGRYWELEAAIGRAHQMVEEGAGIIDIGGEKAGPGEPVSIDEEMSRVIPIIENLATDIGVPLSVDTFKPEVARAAVIAGAEIINGISGFGDEAMRVTAVETGAAIVITHIQGQPRVAHPEPVYADPVREVRDWLDTRARLCIESGVDPESILVDPGPGFGKNTQHDLTIIRRLDQFTSLPYPVLLAASRKKFIGDILGAEVTERLEGSLAVAAWGVLKGVRVVRAHDVRESVRVVRMTEAVLHPESVEERA